MYPSVIDQLESVKRALKDVVRPAVESKYASDVLHWSVRVLNLVVAEVSVGHSLHLREIAAIRTMFCRILPDLEGLLRDDRVAAEVVERVRCAAADAAVDQTDVVRTEARLNGLRDIAAALARTLAFQDGAEAVTDAYRGYVCDLARMNAEAFGLQSYA